MSEVDKYDMRLEPWNGQMKQPTDVVVARSRQSQIPNHDGLRRCRRTEPFGKDLGKKGALRQCGSYHIAAANRHDPDVGNGIEFRASISVRVETVGDVIFAVSRMAAQLLIFLAFGLVQPFDFLIGWISRAWKVRNGYEIGKIHRYHIG